MTGPSRDFAKCREELTSLRSADGRGQPGLETCAIHGNAKYCDRDDCRELKRCVYITAPQSESRKPDTAKVPEGWIKCGDRLPENDGAYLVWLNDDYAELLWEGCWCWLDGDSLPLWDREGLTHWMPLPDAPSPSGVEESK